MILEARCTRCGQIFNPGSTDDEDLIHGETEAGDICGGIGILQGAWSSMTGPRLIKLPEFTRMEAHGIDNPDCSDPDCEFHHPEVREPF